MKLIIITGPSGSGKTSLAVKLSQELKYSQIISTDDFYKTGIISKIFSEIINSYFDKYISHNNKLLKNYIYKILKNKRINYFYKYDFKKKSTTIDFRNSGNIETLIIEGIFTLEFIKYISKYNYLLIKLDPYRDLCLKRIFYRDQIERGKNKNKVEKDFRNAWEIYKIKEKFYKKIDHKNQLMFKKDPDINTILKEINNLNH